MRWLALRVGISDSYVSQLLSGKTEDPSLDIAFRIFVALKIDPTDYAREAGYLPPYDREKLPENLTIAMRRDDWPRDVSPYEVESLATWGMMAEGNPGLDEISPSAYKDLLEELRGKPIDKIDRLFSGVPLGKQQQCYEICRAIVNDWRTQDRKLNEKEETGK